MTNYWEDSYQKEDEYNQHIDSMIEPVRKAAIDPLGIKYDFNKRHHTALLEMDFGFRFTVGNKQLEIDFKDTGAAGTRIDNIEGLPKTEGNTTQAYTIAKKIMEGMAAKYYHKPIKYSLLTDNIQMYNWAINSGKTVFEWDEPIPTKPDTDGYYNFNYTIYP